MEEVPEKDKPVFSNDNLHRLWNIKICYILSAEVELGALFVNDKGSKNVSCLTQNGTNTQPPTHVHNDNKTTTGIANDIVKKYYSRLIKMRWF